MKNVVVIGQGYVGLNIAIHASDKNNVIGFDLNSSLVSELSLGKSHVEDITDEVLSQAIRSNKFQPTSNLTDIVGADIYVIAVPTPLNENREPDISFVEKAAEIVGEAATKSSLVINESTSYPGTLRNVIKKIVDSKSKTSHFFAASPERVDPGRKDYSQKNTPRLIGGIDSESHARAKDFYATFCDVIVEVSSPEIAEAAKLFENTFRQVNIALVNEFAQITHALNLSVREVLDAANTKPYGFMKFEPSAGVGGHCIPVDPGYLSYIAELNGVSARFIDLANKVNLDMGHYIIDRVKKDCTNLTGKTVQIIGVAYKKNIADVRETPANQIYDALKAAGAVVIWHDPLVQNWKNSSSSQLGSDIAIVVTKHDVIDSSEIMKSAKYVFDSTGTVAGAVQL